MSARVPVFDPAVAYPAGSLVKSGSSFYICNSPTKGSPPPGAMWTEFAAGGSADPNTVLDDVSPTFTVPVALTYTRTLAGNSSTRSHGMSVSKVLDQGVFNLTGDAAGITSVLSVSGNTGTVSNAVGLDSLVVNTGEGTITEAVNYQSRPLTDQDGLTLAFTHFKAMASIVGSAIYGFRGLIASAANRWNLYMSGTAQNYLEGSLGVGVAVPLFKLHVNGRVAQGVPITAPLDDSLSNGQMSIYLNENANLLLFRVKYSDGSLKLGTVALV